MGKLLLIVQRMLLGMLNVYVKRHSIMHSLA